MAVYQLRDYQQQAVDNIYQSWGSGKTRPLLLLPTGAGKTVIIAHIIRAITVPTVVIAHRQELVSQISLALARNQVPHRIIGAAKTVRYCQRLHATKTRHVWVDPRSHIGVASVQTIVRRDADPWLKSVLMWVTDEAHHLQPDNMWGRALELFHPTCKGLGVTATAGRSDGRALGNIFDDLIRGPSPRELINQGHLTDYVIYAPTTADLDLAGVNVGATGDYVQKGLKAAVRRSKIIGDVVTHYLRYAPGKLGVTFTTDVETAGDVAAAYRAAGVRAEVLTAKTKDDIRTTVLQRFENRELDQLVTVDIISEGFDLPAIEVASMARPTASRGLCHQQFGRVLRPMAGKERAIIIDHVGNMIRHYPPEYRWSSWSLEGRKGREESEDIPPIRFCPACTQPSPRYSRACIHCGHYEPPAERSAPEFVDGDLQELTPEALQRLIGDIAVINQPVEDYRAELERKGCPYPGIIAHGKRHIARQDALASLIEAMGVYGGICKADGLTPTETQRKFYVDFSVDVLSAQALSAEEAINLRGRILNHATRLGA